MACCASSKRFWAGWAARIRVARVSGFYGSGKSHLLKMIGHLWVNTEFPDGATARSIVPRLPKKSKPFSRSWTPPVAVLADFGRVRSVAVWERGKHPAYHLGNYPALLRAAGQIQSREVLPVSEEQRLLRRGEEGRRGWWQGVHARTEQSIRESRAAGSIAQG